MYIIIYVICIIIYVIYIIIYIILCCIVRKWLLVPKVLARHIFI